MTAWHKILGEDTSFNWRLRGSMAVAMTMAMTTPNLTKMINFCDTAY